jgi:hypothetical protein
LSAISLALAELPRTLAASGLEPTCCGVGGNSCEQQQLLQQSTDAMQQLAIQVGTRSGSRKGAEQGD